MKPIRIYKTSKSVYLYNPNKSVILQIDRQTFNGTEHSLSTNFKTNSPNKTDQIALWIKVRDREKLSNVYLEANVSAIFGVFQQRQGSCYLVVELVEEQQLWDKLLSKKIQNEVRAPNVKIKSAEIFCLKNPLSLISVSIDKITNANIEDKTFKDLFSQFPAVSGEADDNEFFYCRSDSYNISKSLQNQSETDIDEKYLWNSSLLTNNRVFLNLKSALNWCVQLAHGFIAVSQTESSKLVIIAKRSSKFAGTRFLKRGCDLSGNCANDVEVEQILINKRTNQCSSFVQHRASVPGLWTQDIFSISGGEQSMTPQISRPKISIFCNDPSFRAAGRHFSELQRRYDGGKIYILNLLRSHCSSGDHPETEVSALMNQTGEYLKQFNRDGHEIDIINLDMANESKCTVLDKIEEIAHDLVLKVGFYRDADFQPGIEYLNHEENKKTENRDFADTLFDYLTANNSTQKGVIRANCLDCLDRTNTAQLIIGQVALSCQMYALGLLQSVGKITSTTIGVIFPQIFEQMGNAIAQQYGGSTLVHNLESYNKNLNKKNRDLLTTINRYYSNTFSDIEKQKIISVFLDLFYSNEHLLPGSNEFYLQYPYVLAKNVFYESPRRNIAYWEHGKKDFGECADEMKSVEFGIFDCEDGKKSKIECFNLREEVANVKLKSWTESESDFMPNNVKYVENIPCLRNENKRYPRPTLDKNWCFDLGELEVDEDEDEDVIL